MHSGSHISRTKGDVHSLQYFAWCRPAVSMLELALELIFFFNVASAIKQIYIV